MTDTTGSGQSAQHPGRFDGPNHTQTPNQFYDELLPKIKSLAELKVTLAVMRKTFGYHKRADVLSTSQLIKLTGMAEASVSKGVALAQERGTIIHLVVGPAGKQQRVVMLNTDRNQELVNQLKSGLMTEREFLFACGLTPSRAKAPKKQPPLNSEGVKIQPPKIEKPNSQAAFATPSNSIPPQDLGTQNKDLDQDLDLDLKSDVKKGPDRAAEIIARLQRAEQNASPEYMAHRQRFLEQEQRAQALMQKQPPVAAVETKDPEQLVRELYTAHIQNPSPERDEKNVQRFIAWLQAQGASAQSSVVMAFEQAGRGAARCLKPVIMNLQQMGLNV